MSKRRVQLVNGYAEPISAESDSGREFLCFTYAYISCLAGNSFFSYAIAMGMFTRDLMFVVLKRCK